MLLVDCGPWMWDVGGLFDFVLGMRRRLLVERRSVSWSLAGDAVFGF